MLKDDVDLYCPQIPSSLVVPHLMLHFFFLHSILSIFNGQVYSVKNGLIKTDLSKLLCSEQESFLISFCIAISI